MESRDLTKPSARDKFNENRHPVTVPALLLFPNALPHPTPFRVSRAWTWDAEDLVFFEAFMPAEEDMLPGFEIMEQRAATIENYRFVQCLTSHQGYYELLEAQRKHWDRLSWSPTELHLWLRQYIDTQHFNEYTTNMLDKEEMRKNLDERYSIKSVHDDSYDSFLLRLEPLVEEHLRGTSNTKSLHAIIWAAFEKIKSIIK